MDVAALIHGLNLDQSKVQVQAVEDKAQEILRLSQQKCGNLGKDEVARTAVAVLIALQVLGIHYDEASLQKSSTLPPARFGHTLKKIKNLIKSLVDLKERNLASLATMMGGDRSFINEAEQLLKKYETVQCRQIKTIQRGQLDFRGPSHSAAAIYLVSLKRQDKVDKQLLLRNVGQGAKQFNSLCVKMAEACSLMGIKAIQEAFGKPSTTPSVSVTSGNAPAASTKADSAKPGAGNSLKGKLFVKEEPRAASKKKGGYAAGAVATSKRKRTKGEIMAAAGGGDVKARVAYAVSVKSEAPVKKRMKANRETLEQMQKRLLASLTPEFLDWSRGVLAKAGLA